MLVSDFNFPQAAWSENNSTNLYRRDEALGWDELCGKEEEAKNVEEEEQEGWFE